MSQLPPQPLDQLGRIRPRLRKPFARPLAEGRRECVHLRDGGSALLVHALQ